MPQDLREKRHLEVDSRTTFKAANTASEHAHEVARILGARDVGKRELPQDLSAVRDAVNEGRVDVAMSVGLDKPPAAEDLGQNLQQLSDLERSRRIQV